MKNYRGKRNQDFPNNMVNTFWLLIKSILFLGAKLLGQLKEGLLDIFSRN